MLDFLWSLLFFVLALGILVAVHEWGHFYVARLCGVKVHRFSVGFGKALWRKTDSKGTEFVLAAIPLGGYVKMLDERAEDVPPDQVQYAFNRQSVYKRIAIIAAGPLVNLIFAVFALMLMYMIGVQTVKPIVGEITPNSLVERGGLQSDMEILAIGNQTTLDWDAVNLEFVSHIGRESMKIDVRLPESTATKTLDINISDWHFDPDKESAFASLGFMPYRPDPTRELVFIQKDSPAERSGLMAGDKIVAVDGTVVDKWGQITQLIASSPNQQLLITVERGGKTESLPVTIGSREVDGAQQGYLGVVPQSEPWPESYRFTHQYGVLSAITHGADYTWRLMVLSVEVIGKLFTGDVSVKSLSGPISIAQGAGASADYGLVHFLRFLAFISINLGIINLLPLPVLDGGHLLYYVIELLTGKPVPESVQEVGFRIGAALLLVIMTVAIFNDITRL